ncbi:ADP-ribose pyrophosphatase [Desulfosarcina ovata subsp. sediminis]|uniref:GDP-mannose pyrophosphatase n=1 Tax=Desulfosarcina ovata subsp. sediminis TaxID=885957 RepID=A0A5K7ZDI8_9BACT|nr:NUDIX hydrolase [Desulfosarcina ovata]BBO80062.1 ADP-ribose pyrophosphatase [Desulfosarcina ovata subsp. sediminis]
MNKAIVNHTALIRKGRVFDFYAENVTLPNGVTMDMEVIRHPGAAAIVAVLDDGRILLLKQYRHAVGGFIWEIPAGTLDPGEDVDTCAARELTEETGYTAGQIEKLAEILPLPAYSDERIYLYLATGLSLAEQNLDEDELLFVHPVALSDALGMVADGTIQDAKTITGLHLAAARLAKPENVQR